MHVNKGRVYLYTSSFAFCRDSIMYLNFHEAHAQNTSRIFQIVDDEWVTTVEKNIACMH
jgi:hypothetical protein